MSSYNRSVTAALCLLALAGSASAQPHWLVDAHGDYAKLLAPSAVSADGSLAGGGLGVEWLPVPQLGLGLGYQAESFAANGASVMANFINLQGHLYFPLSSKSSLFLQGAAGHQSGADGVGSWQGQAGIGVRLVAAARLAVDLGLQYRLTTPIDAPYQSLGASIGLVVPLDAPFGTALAAESTAHAKTQPAVEGRWKRHGRIERDASKGKPRASTAAR